MGNSEIFVTDSGIWRTNGTRVVAAQFVKGDLAHQVDINGPALIGGELYFYEGDQPMKSNGTASGTTPVKSFPADPRLPAGTNAESPLQNFKGLTYFVGFSDATQSYALMRSDGTVKGTTIVKLLPNAMAGFYFAIDANKLYILTQDEQLWVSDGTAGGSKLLRASSFGPGQFNAYSLFLVAVGKRVVFSSSSGNSLPVLWASDGTKDGYRK